MVGENKVIMKFSNTILLVVLIVIVGSCSVNHNNKSEYSYKLVKYIQFVLKDYMVVIFEDQSRQPVIVLYPIGKARNAWYDVNQFKIGDKISLTLEEVPDTLRFDLYPFPKTSRGSNSYYSGWIADFEYNKIRYEYYDSKSGHLLRKCYFAKNLFILNYMSPLFFQIRSSSYMPSDIIDHIDTD